MTDTAIVQQRTANVVADGVVAGLRQSSIRQLFTANWKTELLLAGRCFEVTVGGIAAGAAEALITGGGAGTVIDSDQPEMIVGVRAGYYMIPISFRCAARVDLDAQGETGEILLFADTTQAPPGSVTGATETPAAMLASGNHSSVALAYSAVTADITDPLASRILDFETVINSDNGTAANAVNNQLKMNYEPSIPHLLKGPCSVVACWGGTAAVTAAASFIWAEVPINRFE